MKNTWDVLFSALCDAFASFNFIKEKFLKLQGSKASLLSLVGRTVLIKSVMITIPNYFMQSMILNKTSIEAITNVIQNFWWDLLMAILDFILVLGTILSAQKTGVVLEFGILEL